jgi:hypothetical protein
LKRKATPLFNEKFEAVLEEMERFEGRYGVLYMPKEAPCGLCGKKVYGDLHLIPLVDGGSAFLCSRCLNVEREKWREREESEADEEELFEEREKDRKRAAEDVFLISYKGQCTVERTKRGRIIYKRGKKGRPLQVPVQLETDYWKFLKKYIPSLRKIYLFHSQVQSALLQIAYFLDRYRRGLKHGLNLPPLELDDQTSIGLLYTAIYNNPRALLIDGVLKKLKRFYKVLPELLGYGIFEYERCFIRPSEVLRLALWNHSTIYIYNLYYTDNLLKRFIIQGGEYYHRGIVLAAFYRELLKWKEGKVLNIPGIDDFIQGVGGVSRRQFFYMSNQFNLLKGEEPFEDLYKKAWRLTLRKDEVREVLQGGLNP